jgi:hypothetical protein
MLYIHILLRSLALPSLSLSLPPLLGSLLCPEAGRCENIFSPCYEHDRHRQHHYLCCHLCWS